MNNLSPYPEKKSLTIGTRTSRLALWQANTIKEQLERQWPNLTCRLEPFVTQGDKTLDKPLPEIGGKGLFTAELEAALRDGRIDLAVHSLKDLPIEDAPELTNGAVSSRADVRDVLIAKNGWTLETLPQGTVVGTSSLRRKAQLLLYRPDLTIRSIRGNVDTRIRKVSADDYDAIVLAAAGVTRLGLDINISDWLSLAVMLPAPGQGAMAVQCRREDEQTRTLLTAVHDNVSGRCVTAERAFLGALGGGCSLPVGAYAHIIEDVIFLVGLVASEDGRQVIRVEAQGREPETLGTEVAEQAIDQGALGLLP